ncbi:type IV secretion system DNA-binding domain-containing protein [Patescibacteria group bacterium]|nr:type IV secretion system DNA-binding domain-containing protein [Patescibacteria group bacterium]MBU0777331.1 type IV secretion system DNA-binding domain-containing protein [Patescibacteria group bacterium]MBU0846089.1 type IV secretion system DNA-binding domain-containing protein [Patescibacteria group bacterium]MBU0923142.1 type IV secretion system DNA-binding domain-containing protein [Patescibacteria group bacterium]MBU1066857.1 type IV secretion system DNA-binding domain-containing prote
MTNLTTLLLKLPRNTEVTPEAAQTFLSALTQINSVSSLRKLLGTKSQALALEIVLFDQQIRFQITCDRDLVPFLKTQIQSNYPLVLIEQTQDPLVNKRLEIKKLCLAKGSYYPIATFESFQDIDPLSSVLSVLSKGNPDEVGLVQFALEATGSSWQRKGALYAERGTKNEDGSYSPRSDANIITEKISYPGFKVTIRLAANTKQTLRELISSFGVFTRADGNRLSSKKTSQLKKKSALACLLQRKVVDNQILNIQELATIWHLPSDKIKTTSIAWGTSVLSEPPENLPIAIDKSEDEKREINYFAKTHFKNKETIFGIETPDRRRHIWTLGKTGTGKSTLIANMAIDDLKKGRGLAVIDPHGDLIEILLDYIPKNRINDVIYFNPADSQPPTINPLEVRTREEAELAASGLLSIFTKIWANVWSARMEYILRNSFLTLAQTPNSTLADVLKLLANRKFRDQIVEKIDDPNLVHFWKEEFDKMPERLQKEAISPIQNKVGQFVLSPMIREIIGQPKGSFRIDEIMDGGKIFLANLSQGRIGEDNANLLGAMLITKIQLAAMHRVEIREQERRDFYLYVDEFQNFATTSFIKILSEARKYRLNLMLANQYIAQIPEEVQKAILGNIGTMISFTAGAEDAQILQKEFSEVFTENDLVNLSRFQVAIKLTIDGQSNRPFLAHTLPLPVSRNQNRPKVITASRERWSKREKPQQDLEQKPYTPKQKPYTPRHRQYPRRSKSHQR